MLQEIPLLDGPTYYYLFFWIVLLILVTTHSIWPQWRWLQIRQQIYQMLIFICGGICCQMDNLDCSEQALLYENAWIWACPLNKGGLTNYLGAVSNLAVSAIKNWQYLVPTIFLRNILREGSSSTLPNNDPKIPLNSLRELGDALLGRPSARRS